MSDSTQKPEPENLPRLICAFAGLFAIGVPAFAVITGTRVHAAIVGWVVEYAAQTGAPAETMLSVRILDGARVASWVLLAVGVVSALSLFALMRKNSSAGTLRGAGRIAVALGLTGALSAFYLATLLFAAALVA